MIGPTEPRTSCCGREGALGNLAAATGMDAANVV